MSIIYKDSCPLVSSTTPIYQWCHQEAANVLQDLGLLPPSLSAQQRNARVLQLYPHAIGELLLSMVACMLNLIRKNSNAHYSV